MGPAAKRERAAVAAGELYFRSEGEEDRNGNKNSQKNVGATFMRACHVYFRKLIHEIFHLENVGRKLPLIM